MKRIFFFLIPILLCSCSASRHVQMQVAEHIQKDTIYLSNLQYDSIYVNHDRLIDRNKDTVLIHDKQVVFRYKLIRDTIRIIKRDSIPYEVRTIETKEVEKTPNLFDVLCYLSSGIIVGFIGYKIVNLIKDLMS